MANLLGTLITGNLRTTQGYGTSDSTRILYPGGGSFVTTTSTITGAIRIKMPVFGSGMMMTCTVKVYEYSTNKSFTITFGGHRDSDNWYNEFCYIDGGTSRANLTVRFGIDDGVNCVWIGETSSSWTYPQVFVTDVQMGYVGYSTSWLSGWSVNFVTAFGTINRTQVAYAKITGANIGSQSVSFATTSDTFSTNWTNYRGVTENAVAGQLMWKNYGNNHTIFDASNGTSPTGSAVNNTNSDIAWTGTYPILMGWNGVNTYGVRVDSARIADSISGQANSATITATTSNTASRIVLRDGSGDIYSRYSFSNYVNTTNNDESGITRFIIKNGDDYHRSATTTVAADAIRNAATGSWAINITGSAGSITNGVYTTQSINSLTGVLNFGVHNATPYLNPTGTSNGISFGGYESSSLRQYGIFTEQENVGGNYSKLTLNYHTGIRLGAYPSYGGIRFYNDAAGNGSSAVIFSVGNGDNHVRVLNNLYVTGTVTGSNLSGTNTGDQTNISGNAATATYATSAGAVAWGNVSSKPSNIMFYEGFTLDANTMTTNSTGFTYANNAPFYGPIARFSTGGAYDLWLGGSYLSGGNSFFLRTRNGDTATLNPWREIITSGNIGSQSVSYATTAGSAPNASNQNSEYLVTPGEGNGLKFWASDNYKISMGASSVYLYGTVTDYSIKTQMNADSPGRGFTWGRIGVVPTASLNATSGNMQIAGTFRSSTQYVANGDDSGTLYGPNATWAASLYVGASGNRSASGIAQAITTDGNLHLDCATNSKQIYINYYSGMVTGIYGGLNMQNTSISNASYVSTNTYVRAGTNVYTDQNYGYGLVGLYTSTRYQGVFAMGDAYKLPADGTTTGSLYGLAWSHPNAGGVAANLNTHGLLVMENGTFLAAISGSIRSRDDMRAPIFYDSADTGYYVDPNSTSNLNYLNIGNTREEFPLLRMGAAGKYAIGVSGAYTRISSHNSGNGVQLGSYDGTTFTPRLTVNNDGNVEASTSLRAPIFYDSQDTTYYLDPAGNGTRAAFLNGNVWISPKSESYGEGIAFLMPSQATWGGLRWVRGVNNFTGAWAFGYFGNESNDNIGFHSGGVNGWRLDHSWNMTTIGSVRAPIFYDSDDTRYSWNPNTSSAHRFSTPYGYVDIGPMNGDWCHFQTDRPRFYFGSSVTVDGDLKRYSDGALYIHSSNYNSYAPTLTGVGASGSWGISVTGSAGGVSWANVSSKPSRWLNATNLIDDNAPDTITESGFWQSYLGSGNPTGTWFNYVNVRHSNPANAHGFQLGMSYYDNNLWFRSYSGNVTYLSWSRALGTHTDPYPSNMNQYVRTTDDVTHNSTTSTLFLVNGHSDNTKGYRIHNTSGSSVSAMFTNSSNQLVIAAGAVDQINLNKKVYVNGVALGVNVAPSTTAGRIDASNDIVAFSSSDERLKENITPIENALDKVKSLTGVEFDWKPEHKEAHGHEGHDTGIIAQQVLGVMPSAVRTNDTGYLAVRYEKLIGLLIEGMKEQQTQIEELKAKLNGIAG